MKKNRVELNSCSLKEEVNKHTENDALKVKQKMEKDKDDR